MLQMITLGGNAELELVDSLDPFSEGIIFSVMPPKKSWKNISNYQAVKRLLVPWLWSSPFMSSRFVLQEVCCILVAKLTAVVSRLRFTLWMRLSTSETSRSWPTT
jgi:hypothetical protein